MLHYPHPQNETLTYRSGVALRRNRKFPETGVRTVGTYKVKTLQITTIKNVGIQTQKWSKRLHGRVGKELFFSAGDTVHDKNKSLEWHIDSLCSRVSPEGSLCPTASQ
jgi:hypothetical protein